MVAATDETGIGCALVVAGEGAVGVGSTLGGLVVPFRYQNEDIGLSGTHLDHDKTSPGTVSPSKVDVCLVVGDIKSLDTAGAGLEGTSIGDASGEQKSGSSSLHD